MSAGTRRRGRRGALAALVAVAALVGTAASCRPEPTLTLSVVASDLANPWDIAFRPSGNFFFTERAGRINVMLDGQRRVLGTPADVVALGEGGMLGIAVDPAYGTNRRIYTCFLSNASGSLDVRIVRFEVNATDTGLVNRADIKTGIPANQGRHAGCRIRFGPDGYLWVGTGDAATATVPQDPTSLGGKVLRITTSGAGAPGNAGAPFRSEVYTYGHRNVQGVAFGPDGKAYAVEHGTNRDDEVNLLAAGANYGWDPRAPGGTTYDETQPMTDLVKFPDAHMPIWSSGSTTIAPSGGTFLSGAQWAGWDKALAMAVLKGQQLRVLGLDAGGTAVEVQWTRIQDHGRLRVAVQAPNGDLYLTTDANPGQILRVHATAP